MFRVNGIAELPATLIEAGDAEQDAEAGAPEQANVTAPVNPLTGVSCRLNVAACPATTVADVDEPPAAPIEKSIAVPPSGTVC